MEAGEKKQTRRHRLGFWLSIGTAVLVVLGMIILIMLPFALEWGAEHMLRRVGAKTANISDVDFNPMTGRLIVFNLQVEGPNGDKLTMERLVVKVDLFPFVKKRIYFREVALTGFALDIRQLEDSSVVFAGLSIPEAQNIEEPQPDVEGEKTPWGLGLRNLDIKELTIHLITPDLDETVVLHQFSLTDFESWAPEKQGDHVLRIGLLGGTIDVEGSVRPFSDPIAVSTRIGIRELSLNQVMPFLKDTPLKSLSGSLSGRGQVNATLFVQSDPSITSTVRLDVFSTDTALQTSGEGFEMELQPGALNIGVSLESKMGIGENSYKEAKFSAAASLQKAISHIASKGAAIDISQDTLSLKVSGSYSDTGTVNPSNLKAEAGISFKGLAVKNGDSQAQLLRVGSLDVEGVEIDGPDEIRTSQARVEKIVLLPRLPASIRKGEPEQALDLNSLEVNGISLSDRSRLTVDTVQVESLNAWVLREKNGELEAVNVLQEIRADTTKNTSGETAGETEAGGPQTDTNLEIKLGRFTLTGENSLTVRDLAVDPPFNFMIDSMSASVVDISTGESGSPTEVTVSTGMGKYSALNINGTIQPPLNAPDVDIHIEVKAIDLPPLTPYTSKYLGYILRSGHLDTKMDILVDKGTLDSTADIVVNRIELNAVKEEDEKRAEERLGIPINTALSLLTDKNDDINLTLPIKGDLKDPEFKISDVALSATGLALKKGVTAYYKSMGATLLTGGLIPPGTFGLFGKVFSGVTTMTFEPVTFDPLATQLDDFGKTRLDLMAEKLESKPKVRLVMCGKVTREDIKALRQADYDASPAAMDVQALGGTSVPSGQTGSLDNTGQIAEPGLAAPLTAESGTFDAADPARPPSIEEVALNDDEKERLIDLAKQRALSVKDYLIEVGGLDPERLFVCYSDVEIDDKELPPRVDLSI